MVTEEQYDWGRLCGALDRISSSVTDSFQQELIVNVVDDVRCRSDDGVIDTDLETGP